MENTKTAYQELIEAVSEANAALDKVNTSQPGHGLDAMGANSDMMRAQIDAAQAHLDERRQQLLIAEYALCKVRQAAWSAL